MNACVIAYTFYEMDQRVKRYAEALAARGDHVDVIALKGEGQKDIEMINGVNVYRIQKRIHNENGMMDYFLRIGKFFIKGSLLLIKNNFKNKYNVIHINSVPDYLVFMGFIPKIFGTKLILDVHDLMPEFFSQKFHKSMESFYIRMLLLMEYISVKFADHTIIANDLWREKIILRDNIDSMNCSTLLNYPNMDHYDKVVKKEKNDTIDVIYPGTISHHHGIDIAIKAIHSIKKKNYSVILHLYAKKSSNIYGQHLNNLINELSIAENIKFVDPVRPEDIYKIYSNADIGIVPKRDGVFSGEAFSTKIYDYMASGLPIVASRTKIDEYYFDDTMISFFEPENYEEMANCIVNMYTNKNISNRMIDKCKDYVIENSWANKKKIYIDIVDNLN